MYNSNNYTCKKNRKIERKKVGVFCWHDDHVGYISKLYDEESFRSSNKLL
jgi:hypothetical protein